jgi:hypothetical protein
MFASTIEDTVNLIRSCHGNDWKYSHTIDGEGDQIRIYENNAGEEMVEDEEGNLTQDNAIVPVEYQDDDIARQNKEKEIWGNS